ncbi:hypothetical protein [Spirobacillus cienkowskii]|uniref:hypothetical protein n=1 Tax=Spirobacillus cienkowskii TaxID=495820 RepID=UPI0030CF6C8C
MKMNKIYSPFQFLLMVYCNEEYHKKLRHFNLEKILLTGIPQDQIRRMVSILNLTEKIIDFNEIDSLNDPVRRFFETKLAFRISKKILVDVYFINKLKFFFEIAFLNLLNISTSDPLCKNIFIKNKIHYIKEEGRNPRKLLNLLYYAKEKYDLKAETMLHTLENYSSSEKNIIDKFLNYTWLSLYYEYTIKGYKKQILDVYGKDCLSNAYRGKILKEDQFKKSMDEKFYSSYSSKAGIMRSSDPAPYYDRVIHPRYSSNNRLAIIDDRCPDMHIPKLSSQEKNHPYHISKLGVHPFVNSLSGTILAILRVYIETLCETVLKNSNGAIKPHHFVYNNFKYEFARDNQFFINFFKLATSLLLYLEGGHCLIEFYLILKIPEVQRQLSSVVPGFQNIRFEYLYKETNEKEFNLAIQESYKYMEVYLNRKEMLKELRKN